MVTEGPRTSERTLDFLMNAAFLEVISSKSSSTYFFTELLSSGSACSSVTNNQKSDSERRLPFGESRPRPIKKRKRERGETDHQPPKPRVASGSQAHDLASIFPWTSQEPLDELIHPQSPSVGSDVDKGGAAIGLSRRSTSNEQAREGVGKVGS